MGSIFNKIINGEISAHVVAETDEFLAFLDINPLAKGHTLVIPKQETDYIFDIENVEYQKLWLFAKSVAHGIKEVFPCEKIGVSVVGLEVPHAHIHLIPINSVADMNFSKEKLVLTQDELVQIAKSIQEAI